MRDAADDRTDLIVSSLEEALRASKGHKVPCSSCGQIITVNFPDATARTNAAAKLVEMGYGRAPNEETVEELDLDVDVATLPKAERDALRARLFTLRPDLRDKLLGLAPNVAARATPSPPPEENGVDHLPTDPLLTRPREGK